MHDAAPLHLKSLFRRFCSIILFSLPSLSTPLSPLYARLVSCCAPKRKNISNDERLYSRVVDHLIWVLVKVVEFLERRREDAIEVIPIVFYSSFAPVGFTDGAVAVAKGAFCKEDKKTKVPIAHRILPFHLGAVFQSSRSKTLQIFDS